MLYKVERNSPSFFFCSIAARHRHHQFIQNLLPDDQSFSFIARELVKEIPDDLILSLLLLLLARFLMSLQTRVLFV
jgi:hypothetical protein